MNFPESCLRLGVRQPVHWEEWPYQRSESDSLIVGQLPQILLRVFPARTMLIEREGIVPP